MPREFAQQLRTTGVPAGKSATALDIISDPLLWERELYRFVSDHREGQRPVLAAPWRMSSAETEIDAARPISASTTTMFVTRSWVPMRWRNDDRGDEQERRRWLRSFPAPPRW